MAQLISVRLSKSDHQPLGFRLQGGKDFGTPLVIQKVNGGSAAEAAGLQAGDAVIRVNSTDVYNLRHQEAQDVIRASGHGMELTVQRGGGTWRPSVTPTGSLPRPGQMGAVSPVTKTSLKASPQPSLAFGSGHNSVAKPYNYTNGCGDSTMKSIVNKQYNTPVGMYSDQTIAETLSAQTEVLAGGVLGVNFKKNEKSYDAEKSAVFKMLQEDSNDPEPDVNQSSIAPPISGLRHVAAPVAKPDAPINNTGGLPPGQNICEECERLIIGVFVRIKDKNLHVECFKCATCGSSLKNQGYYNLNGKLYCDIHAKLVARQNPPAPNLEPVTIAPGGKFPSGTYSAPLSAHTTPLPPLSTNNYSNGSSSLFSPSSNVSGPKPFGSSGSAYSPSLSPRSAPISPATRPLPVHHAPLPASVPHAAHAPVSAPNMENPTHYVKPEYKSAAEERLIKKMAKMALNGYEIGIQRKITPGDHLQLMANQIQDTIVTKHPLNHGNGLEDDKVGRRPFQKNSQGSLERVNGQDETGLDQTNVPSYSPSYKRNGNHFETKIKPNENIINIGDKIKDTVINKHPSKQHSLSLGNPNPDNNGNKLIHIGGKIQDTIVNKHPYNLYSTNHNKLPNSRENNLTLTNSHGYNENSSEEMELQKYLQDSTMRAQFLTTILDDSNEKISIKSNDESDNKPTINNKDGTYKNDLLTNGGLKSVQHEKNVKATIKAIEKNDTTTQHTNTNEFSGTRKYSIDPKNNNTSNGTVQSTLSKYNEFSNKTKDKVLKKSDTSKCDQQYKKDLSQSQYSSPKGDLENDKEILYDNSLYTPKNHISNGTNNLLKKNSYENDNGSKNSDDGRSSSEKESNLKSESFTDPNTETVVKMRQKTRETPRDGGKRDSHIVSRPKSTIAALDFTDGMYPVCHVDDKAITRGPFITALGRIWCPDHFICVNASCRRPLQDIGFVEENGQLYCEYCFEQFIAPACDKCHAKIKGDCLNAIGKHFHPECFNCVYCGKLFGNNPFFLEDGLPYCEADWNELFTTKCFACGFPVEAGDRWVEALNNNYHSQCFNCTMCKKNLEGQSFFAKGGRPFCKNHAR